ncbi:variable adherence-associated lipoprotein adhesin Vaa [Metamycoplasma hominis]|uniref:variable adherence-associated lipoprotein adhesin Vaa n=1 Tax=Metamycoplasma hominis TaxID=2098 RepID=UPI00158BDAE8|nr:variable adherence-associated lipoprotein adhesin Vaa [Metamycoplasma hominis]QKX40632.1 variable adherence-associated lipoprotein adhesin Vaa [Metamycoplasma hominis]
MKKSKKIFITLCGIATTAILPVATISCNDDKLAEKNGKEKADAALKQANTLAEELKKNPDYSKILETLNKEIAEATKSFKEAGSYSDYPAIISKLSAAIENAKSEKKTIDDKNAQIAKELAERNAKIQSNIEELKKINNEAFELSKTVNKTIAEVEKKFKIEASFKEQLENFADDLLDKSRQIDEFTTVTSAQEGFTLAELESFKEITTTWFNGMKSEWARVLDAWKKEIEEINEDKQIKSGIEELNKLNVEVENLKNEIEQTIKKVEDKKFKIDEEFKKQLDLLVEDLSEKSRQIDSFITVTATQEGFNLLELETFKQFNTSWFKEVKAEWAKVLDAWKEQLK